MSSLEAGAPAEGKERAKGVHVETVRVRVEGK